MPPVVRRLLLVGIPLVLLAAAVWLAVTALRARDDLERVRSALPEVRAAVTAGDGAGVRPQLDQMRTDAAAAYDSTHDPVWAVAAHVPLLGQPLATVRGLTGAVRELAGTGLPALAQVTADLQPSALRPEPDRVDVQRVARAAGPLQIAAQSVAGAQAGVARLRPSWLPVVADARSELLDQLTPLASSSGKAATAARLLPPMLGMDGTRRYFVGFQNPAEARGTGGLLGAYAIVTADRGRVRVARLGANYQLPELPDQVPGLDADYVARYGAQGAVDLWVNANVSPDFPEVARTWLAMWRAGTGQQLDGALALDPTVLAAVVRATGPLRAAGVGEVTADQVEPLVLREQYAISQDVKTRRDAMVGVGRAAIEALLAGRADPRRLLTELGGVGGHALVESSRQDEQDLLGQAGLSGAVSTAPTPYAQAVVVNAAGGKLDAYLDTSLDYRATRCSSDAREVVVTVRLHNDAPTSGLAPYVVVRADDPPYRTVPGQNRTDLRVLVTRGAQLTAAALDGRPLLAPTPGVLPDVLAADSADAFLSRTTQAGRPSFGLTLELPPGQTRELQLTLSEPPSTLAPQLPLQAAARTPKVSSDVGACG